MKRPLLAGLVFFAACGNANGGGAQPTSLVAISIAVDDTANRTYGPGQLAWKGAMKVDPVTRVAVKDESWTGPWATLEDDGPWPEGGSEGPGALAGDHVLGATVFMEPPANPVELEAGRGAVEYGVVDALYERPPPAGVGNGWLWKGPNGAFALQVGQTGNVVAAGMALEAWGKVDLRLTLDVARLEAREPPWDTSSVWVKSSAWGWGALALRDDGAKGDEVAGDGVYTCVLSEWVGAGRVLSRTGLLACGSRPEFVWMLGGSEPGVHEYWDLVEERAPLAGVAADTRAPGGAWTSRELERVPKNTAITVPCNGGGGALRGMTGSPRDAP